MIEADFLHTLTPAESDALEEMGEPGAYPVGTVIFGQGGTPDRVLLVRGRHVRIALRGPGGAEIVSRRLREAEARGNRG